MRQDESVAPKGPKGNVIAMNLHRPEARFPHIAEVEAYWHALRGTRLAPVRSEVDPRGIARALERAFILEKVAPGVGRLRIAGTHLADLLGMEVRGMPLSAFIIPDARPHLASAIDMVCTKPATICLTLTSDAGIGKPPLEARLLMLPLRDAMGAMTRILGCFDTFGPLGRAPRRFGIAARKVTPLTGEAFVPAETQAAPTRAMQDWHAMQVTLPPPPMPGFRETQTGYDSAPQHTRRTDSARRRPDYLRLITPDPS